MNSNLQTALTELQDAGALKLPRPETVEEAKSGKIWSGKKLDGELWTLAKNNGNSFSVTC